MRALPWKWIGVGVLVALLTVGMIVVAEDNDDDPPPRQLSTLEAACGMLADGDTAEEAYDILLGLDVAPVTASRAVNRAIAGEC
jgi:hypothetical protein